jgi:hypothetical protein
MTSIEWLRNELVNNENIRWRGTNINVLIEQAKEMHHKELMGSMQRGMEMQEKENNRIGFRERNGLLPQQEISDEEIEIGAINFCIKNIDQETMSRHDIFVETSKWYREQLKQK